MDADDELEGRFNAAADWVAGSISSGQAQGFTDGVKLTFYGLYKQATAGKCNTSQPAFWSRAARLKWDAWNKLGSMAPETAMTHYVELLNSIAPGWSGGSGGDAGSDEEGGGEGAGAAGTSKGGGGVGGGFGPVFSTFAMLDNGGQEEDGQHDGEEGLHEVAGKGDQQGVLDLLESGTDVNDRDQQGCTALHFAADRGQAETASLLIAHGADVNALDEDGQAPLHYAALCGNEQLASLLLAAGADLGLRDASGATARDIAPAAWQCWGE